MRSTGSGTAGDIENKRKETINPGVHTVEFQANKRGEMMQLNWDDTEQATTSDSDLLSKPAASPDHKKPVATKPQTSNTDSSSGGVTGLESLEMGAARIRVDDKKIINCRADLNQLVPFKYEWAWEKYLAACNNHWMPQEINMSADIALWKSENGLPKHCLLYTSDAADE